MKRSNFLKLLFGSLLMITMIFIFSCTKPKPLCEQNNFGHITVLNYTSIFLWVNSTNDGGQFNDKTRLAPGGSKLFVVNPGEITIWAASDDAKAMDKWNVGFTYVTQCDEATFIWTSGKGTSDEPNKIYNVDQIGIKEKHK